MGKLMYYSFDQNNSGGYCLFNEKDGISDCIVVEAFNEDQANMLFDEIVKEYSNYCPCCGERWYGVGAESSDINGLELDLYTRPVFIHYLDGTIKTYKQL